MESEVFAVHLYATACGRDSQPAALPCSRCLAPLGIFWETQKFVRLSSLCAFTLGRCRHVACAVPLVQQICSTPAQRATSLATLLALEGVFPAGLSQGLGSRPGYCLLTGPVLLPRWLAQTTRLKSSFSAGRLNSASAVL